AGLLSARATTRYGPESRGDWNVARSYRLAPACHPNRAEPAAPAPAGPNRGPAEPRVAGSAQPADPAAGSASRPPTGIPPAHRVSGCQTIVLLQLALPRRSRQWTWAVRAAVPRRLPLVWMPGPVLRPRWKRQACLPAGRGARPRSAPR